MKARITVRLVMHVLVAVGILGFLVTFPAMLPGLLLSIVRIDVIIKACSTRPEGCIALPGFWTVIIVAIVLLVQDIRMLRKGDDLERRLSRSLALELLLPAGWYATLFAMGGADTVGPVWFLVPGPPILLSAAASAVVAWLLVKDRLKASVSAVRLWIERAVALVLTLIAGAIGYLLADIVLSQF